MLKAKALMKTDVISVNCKTTMNGVIAILAKNNITGLPVVDDDMCLVGVVTEKDILRFLSDLDQLKMLPDIRDSSAKVEDFMTKEVICFDQEEELDKVCDCLIQNNFRRVPILANGKLAGIISRRDIITIVS